MMNPDDPAVVDILRRAMVARIATVSCNGRPHVNPLYFVYGNGKIYLGTTDRTLAALNVKADPRVTILFNIEREPNDRRVLRIRGGAVVRTDSEVMSVVRTPRHAEVLHEPTWAREPLAHARLLPVVRRSSRRGRKERSACSRSDRRTRNLTAPRQTGLKKRII